MRIEKLDKSYEERYARFLGSDPDALFYGSLEYRRLLKRYLGADDCYLLALDAGGEIRGALPAFVSPGSPFGRVMNSLPYFGSNGGVVNAADENVAHDLLAAYVAVEAERGCAASTLVSSPFDRMARLYPGMLPHDGVDSRTGQITGLPAASAALDEELLGLFEESGRRNIRKAVKSGVTWRVSHDPADMRFLHETHRQNIETIGGIAKEWAFFRCVQEEVSPESYAVYVAEHEGERCAALLIFRFQATVEYFTPATCEAQRNLQPLSLLIFEAMKDAAVRGFRWWNWGGTWLTQEGVYRFKRKWGARDYPYHYYTRVRDKSILGESPQALREAFPHFFVVPYAMLAGRAAIGGTA